MMPINQQGQGQPNQQQAQIHAMAQNVQQQQQPQQQSSQQQGQQSGGSNAGSERYDHIGRVRNLVWQMKESLANLMKVAGSNINHNSQIDSGLKTGDDKVIRFDKALEEFFSICNQIELHLKTIQECVIQQRDSQKYLPFNVSSKADSSGMIEGSQDNTVSYGQYLTTIKTQIHYGKVIQETLLDGARKIGQMDPPSMSMAPGGGPQGGPQGQGM
jgi:hypothetical protein